MCALELKGYEFRELKGRDVGSIGFINFIVYMELLDLLLVGRKFTWFQPNWGTSNRFDIFLVPRVSFINGFRCPRGLSQGMSLIIVMSFSIMQISYGFRNPLDSIINGLVTII